MKPREGRTELFALASVGGSREKADEPAVPDLTAAPGARPQPPRFHGPEAAAARQQRLETYRHQLTVWELRRAVAAARDYLATRPVPGGDWERQCEHCALRTQGGWAGYLLHRTATHPVLLLQQLHRRFDARDEARRHTVSSASPALYLAREAGGRLRAEPAGRAGSGGVLGPGQELRVWDPRAAAWVRVDTDPACAAFTRYMQPFVRPAGPRGCKPVREWYRAGGPQRLQDAAAAWLERYGTFATGSRDVPPHA